MYVIVEIAGLQYKVKQDQQLFVNRLKGEAGDVISFDKVLLSDNGSVTIGAPVIEGMAVEAKILSHVKGDKVVVFKKKRRKGYAVKNGYRHSYTQIEITSLGANAKASSSKKEVKPAVKADNKVAAVEVSTKETKSAAKADDLTKVEGIGPKIASTLVEAGIDTFALLAKTDSAKISEIIAGVRGNHITDTWPKQAELAAAGKWEELKKWQDELDGGKPNS